MADTLNDGTAAAVDSTTGERRSVSRMAVLEGTAGIIAADLDEGISGIVLDLGPAGMMVQAMTPLEPDSPRALCFTLPQTNITLKIAAVVVWSDPEGRAGLRFDTMPENDRRHLESWLAENSVQSPFEFDPFQLPMATMSTTEDAVLTPANSGANGGHPAELTVGISRLHPAHTPEPLGSELHELETSSTVDQKAWSIVEEIRRLTPAHGAVVAVAQGDFITCRASWGSAPGLGAHLQPENGLSGESFRSGQAILCKDAAIDSRVPAAVSQRLGLRTILVVPITGTRGSLGLVEALSRDPNAFTDEHIRVLTRLAGSMLQVLEPQRKTQANGLRTSIEPRPERKTESEIRLHVKPVTPRPPAAALPTSPPVTAVPSPTQPVGSSEARKPGQVPPPAPAPRVGNASGHGSQAKAAPVPVKPSPTVVVPLAAPVQPDPPSVARVPSPERKPQAGDPKRQQPSRPNRGSQGNRVRGPVAPVTNAAGQIPIPALPTQPPSRPLRPSPPSSGREAPQISAPSQLDPGAAADSAFDAAIARSTTSEKTSSAIRIAAGGGAAMLLLALSAALWTYTHRERPLVPQPAHRVAADATSPRTPAKPPEALGESEPSATREQPNISAPAATETKPPRNTAVTPPKAPPRAAVTPPRPATALSTGAGASTRAVAPEPETDQQEVFAEAVNTQAIRVPAPTEQDRPVHPPNVPVGSSGPLALPPSATQPRLAASPDQRQVVPARLLQSIAPAFPSAGPQGGGSVMLSATIDSEGRPTKVKVLGGHPRLVEAAVSAFSKWRYQPATVDGRAVPFVMEVKIVFNNSPR